jgi:hypothetical protein
MPVTPFTIAAVDRPEVVSPNCPLSFAPNVHTVPSFFRPTEWTAPAATAQFVNGPVSAYAAEATSLDVHPLLNPRAFNV